MGLVLAVVYMFAMLASNTIARAAVREGLRRAGRDEDARFMVTPVAVNPFRRDVTIDVDGRYERGALWFEPGPHFRPFGFGIDTGLDDADVREAAQTPRARAYLGWSRFPFAVVDRARQPPMVWFNDYRYSDVGPSGWSAMGVPGRK